MKFKNSLESSPVKWTSWRLEYQSWKTDKHTYSDIIKKIKKVKKETARLLGHH